MIDTIAAAARALDTGETTSAALVLASLAAIEANGPSTNAFVSVDVDGARAAGARVDAERARGIRRGPLHGVPLSLKDLIDVAGVVTTAGSRVIADRVPAADACIVRRLRDAGAVIIGRTNLHEFAFGTTSEHSAFGAVRHPLDPSRSAGGSSGGSAAAVAMGMGLASIGTDTGGSIRIPAASCGVVGLKPTGGEVPLDGVIPLSPSLDHVGPLARTVQDAAWVYAILAGFAPSPIVAVPVTGLRLRRVGGYFGAPLDPIVRDAFDAATGALSAAGVAVSEATIAATDRIADVYLDIVLPEAAHWHAHYLATRADRYIPAIRARIELGHTVPAIRYLAAQAARAGLRAAVDLAFGEADALILPTLPIVAPTLGAETIVVDAANGGPVPVRSTMLKHTQLFNLTGHPAMSLPIASRGLPVGLQLVGRLNATARLIEVAAACERVLAAAQGVHA